MRSLLWKFWLAIWMAVIGMLAAAVVVLTQWHRFESYLAVEKKPNVILRQLAVEIEAAISDGDDIRPLLEKTSMSEFGEVYLIDREGVDYLGRPLPADIAVGAYESGSMAAAPFSPPIFAHSIQVDDQHSYFMIFVFEKGTHPMWMLFRRGGAPWAIVVSLVISGLISGWLALLVVRPINHLARVSARHSQGDFDTSPDERYRLRRDEIGRLARQLAESAKRIKQLVQRQKEFWRDVSHEVRAPLARLQLAAESVEVDATDTRALQHIQREVGTIDRLVQNLLHLSRSSGISSNELQHVDIVNLLGDCERTLSIIAESKQVNVQLVVEQPARELYGNVELLRRMFENVLDNALRHAPPGSCVDIRGFKTDQYYQVCVRDQGPGVHDDRLREIFEPFVRMDPARRRETGGFGIGLAMVHNIAKMHGGTVVANNVDPTGLAINITLPLGKPRAGRGHDALKMAGQ
ncbi:MAG: ATP-binding protein [Woeseiaceae bacterium]|nr:ATP-binding protein [Woeseiaceae bacterium]